MCVVGPKHSNFASSVFAKRTLNYVNVFPLLLPSRISFYHHRQRREATDGEEDLMEEEDDPLPPIKHILSEEEFFLRPSVSSDANAASRQRQGRAEGGGGAAAAALRGNGGWCEGSEGVLCMLFNAFNGKRDGAGKVNEKGGQLE